MEVPNEPGLCPNTGLEKYFLSDQPKASKMSTLCQLVLTKIPDKRKMCETPALSRRQGDLHKKGTPEKICQKSAIKHIMEENRVIKKNMSTW